MNLSFEFFGCEISYGAASSFDVVEIIDLVSHGESDDRGPFLRVEQLDLHSPPE